LITFVTAVTTAVSDVIQGWKVAAKTSKYRNIPLVNTVPEVLRGKTYVLGLVLTGY
jgi:hypothetical protein